MEGCFRGTQGATGIIGFGFLGPAIESPLDLNAVEEKDIQVIFAAVGIFFMAVSTALIAVPMYPILRKRNEIRLFFCRKIYHLKNQYEVLPSVLRKLIWLYRNQKIRSGQ